MNHSLEAWLWWLLTPVSMTLTAGVIIMAALVLSFERERE